MEIIRESIIEINNRSPIVNEIPFVKSIFDNNIFYLFQDNNVEVEVDIKRKTVSFPLSFKEIKFLDDMFPHLDIHRFRITPKKYL